MDAGTQNRVQSLRDKGLFFIQESNACLPIGRLPPETLSAIFLEAAAAEYEAKQTTRTRIRISCVSHHWRAVALSTPALWCTLVLRDYSNVPGLQACFTRSKNLPLHMHIIAPSWAEAEFLPPNKRSKRWGAGDAMVLINEISRAESLHVDESNEHSRFLSPKWVSHSLKRLKLSDDNFSDPMSSNGWERLDTREYAPLDLFHQLDTTFPNLQLLEITGRGVGLGDLVLPNSLIDLCIDNDLAFRREEDTADILKALRNLPALEHLSLTNATTKLEANAMNSLEPVVLPQLKVFRFEGPTATCLAFTKSLQLPPCARRQLTVTHRELRTSEAEVHLRNELVAKLAKWENRFSSAIMTTYSGIGFRAWKQTQSLQELELMILDDSEYRPTSADLQVHFQENSNDSALHDAVRYELLLAHVQTLVLSLEVGSSQSRSSINAPTFFAHLNELKVMSCVFPVEPFINRKPYMLADRNNWKTHLPQLRVLRLHRFVFFEENYDDLFALCQERQKMGGKLEVCLRSCYEVSEVQLEKLRGMTDSVDWDKQIPPPLRFVY